MTKAVFSVAGLGSPFLPATTASPKEMLSVVDKPLSQDAIEEAIAAGITEWIFATGRSKRAIEDRFDKSNELDARGKGELLALVGAIRAPHVRCFYVPQAQAVGHGHAVFCAEPIVGHYSLTVILANDLLDRQTPVTHQLLDSFQHFQRSIIAVEDVPREETQSPLRDELKVEALLVTRSEEGMSLFTQDRHIRARTQAREVYDVSGAGDTVIATLATALGAGYSLEDAAHLANRAAGLVVGKVSTATVTLAELEAAARA